MKGSEKHSSLDTPQHGVEGFQSQTAWFQCWVYYSLGTWLIIITVPTSQKPVMMIK